ncbi:MAG: hypothetical protein QF415_06215 [Candidatus Undinarchaeales archaeon]|nr:hypothetical protein [Candidatus Undinarchaeales archaeon]MDP7492046.1 hypothetical protein [Candidatus Undinarchaeales archaeon]
MREVECDRCHFRWTVPENTQGRYAFVQCHRCGRLIYRRHRLVQERLDDFLVQGGTTPS